MSHDKIIQAIRIYLPDEVTEDISLGIFTSDGASEIRIAEGSLSSVDLSWATGLLAKNGIGDIKESGTCINGGSPANYDGTNFELINTAQWLLELKDLGIYLPGLTAEIWEFRGTEYDSDATSAEVIKTGIIENIDWGQQVISIPIKDARYKRNASIVGTVNTVDFPNADDDMIGKPIPATFGEHDYAKFIRPSSKERIINESELYGGSGTGPEYLESFPVTYHGGTLNITVKTTIDDEVVSTYPDDWYIFIVSGTGKGECAKIAGYFATAYNVYFTIDRYLLSTLNVDTTSSDRSWAQIKQISGEFCSDHFKCEGFKDENGVIITAHPLLYTYDNQFSRIAEYGVNIDTSETNNNKAIIQPKYSENNNPFNLNSFIIKPCSGLSLIENTSGDSGLEGYIGAAGIADYNKICSGLWCHSSYYQLSTTLNLSNSANAYDRDDSSYGLAEFDETAFYTGSNRSLYMIGLEFTLPIIPDGYDFTECYLLLKLKSKVSTNSSLGMRMFDLGTWIEIIQKRFDSSGTKILNQSSYGDKYFDIMNLSTIDCMLDDYTIPARTNNDLYFNLMPETETIYGVSGRYGTLKGHTIFKITAVDKYEYGSIRKSAIILHRDIGSYNDSGKNLNDFIRFYELSVAFKMSQTIDKNIYSAFNGRIFNDTWNTRKTAANLIENPVDILEHACRLQDWSETGETGTKWGKEYATSALIKTGSVEGSFDSSALNTLTDQTPAFQIDNERDGTTDEIKKLMCRIYDLCTYVDPDGTECVETLELTDPAETVTFDDIKQGAEIGPIQEPLIENIFCEPVCNYEYNYGSGEYGKSLRVYNIQNYVKGDNWDECSSGFANQTDAESVLDIYYALWLKYRSVEQCPADFSDCLPIVTYADALSYLVRKGGGMDLRSLPGVQIDYEKGYEYHYAKHVQFNHPITGNADVECVIESVEKSKNNNRVTLDLLILEDIPAL